MINENEFSAPEPSVSPKPKKHTRRLRAALGAALALGLAGSVAATVDPLQIKALAKGFSHQKHVELETRGPSDVLQSVLVFQPGADTGWHTHPGPVVAVVESGALTEYQGNGCVIVHHAGSAFFEAKGEVHRAVNETGAVTRVFATFISPAGALPLIPAPGPGAGRCHDHR